MKQYVVQKLNNKKINKFYGFNQVMKWVDNIEDAVVFDTVTKASNICDAVRKRRYLNKSLNERLIIILK